MTPAIRSKMSDVLTLFPGRPASWYRSETGIAEATWTTLRRGEEIGSRPYPGDAEREARLDALIARAQRGSAPPPHPPRTINEYRIGIIDAAAGGRGGVSALEQDGAQKNAVYSAPKGESTLREITVQCRDFVKAGVMREEDVDRKYRVGPHHAHLICEAIRLGLVDAEMASEGEIPAYTANAEPGHAVKPWTGPILVIGDCHAPFTHREYLDFCQRVRDKYRCEQVIHIGDEADNHALSFHESDPDGYSAGHEAEAAMRELRRWYAAFPDTSVMLSNHGSLPFRRAYSHGIPRRMMRTYREIWDAPPGWIWYQSMDVEGESMVHFTHGTGYSGRNAPLNIALAKRKSTVIGHIHSGGGVSYHANEQSMVFGLNVGCGIDVGSYAAAYGRHYKDKPTLGAGVIMDEGRTGVFVPML